MIPGPLAAISLAQAFDLAVSLGGLWGFVLLLRWVASKLVLLQRPGDFPDPPLDPVRPETPKSSLFSPAPREAPVTTTELAPGDPVVAVVAAAVHMILRYPHRVLTIHRIEGSAIHADDFDQLRAWSREGRRDIFSSHHLR